MLVTPAAASADSLVIRIHGPGWVIETSAQHAINCRVDIKAPISGFTTPDSIFNCTSPFNYTRGTAITLEASVQPDAGQIGWHFDHWVEGVNGNQNCAGGIPGGLNYDPSCTFNISAANATLDVYFTDQTKPDFTVDTPVVEGSFTRETRADFRFHSNDLSATFFCGRDTTVLTACTERETYEPGDGTHTFRVAARDAAGNQTDTFTRTWTIDTTNPVTTITAGPAQNTTINTKTATFAFTAADATAVTYECSGDGIPGGPCTSPVTTANLGDGDRTFRVRARDRAGNESLQIVRAYKVDTIVPTVTIQPGGPTANWNSKTATLTFNSNEPGATFQCRVDGSDATYAPCANPYTTASLTEGLHTFFVRATDAGGNVSVAQSRSWTVDTVPPTITLTGGPADGSATTATTASFPFTFEFTPQCRIDGTDANYGACLSPFITGQLSEGPHTLYMRAFDPANNTTVITRTWTVDTVKPTLAFTAGPAKDDVLGSASATISWAATDATALTTTCRLDGAPVACPAPTITLTNLSEGPHTFEVKVVDRAGNDRSDSKTWITDAKAPLITVFGAPDQDASVNQIPSLTWSTDEQATFTCKVDTAPAVECSSGVFSLVSLPDGPHTVVIAAKGQYVRSSDVSRRFVLDRIAPETSIDDGPGEGTTVSNLFTTFLFSSNETSTFVCTLDGAEAPCTSPASSTLTSGAHTFTVAARDAAGNVDGSPATRSWTIGVQQLPAPGPTDNDKDGVIVPTDCDDNNAAIRPGAVDVPGDGKDQDCDGHDAALSPVSAVLGYAWRFKGSEAWPTRLLLKSVPVGATVAMKCTGPKKACTFKSKSIKGTGKDLDLRKLVIGSKHLKAGAVVTIEITAPNTITKVTSFTVRKGKAPTGGTFACRAPGAKKTTKCT